MIREWLERWFYRLVDVLDVEGWSPCFPFLLLPEEEE